jgi:hypothetical protein
MGKLPEHKPRAGHSIRDHGQVTQSRTTGWSPEQKPFEKLLSFSQTRKGYPNTSHGQVTLLETINKLLDHEPQTGRSNRNHL